MLWAEQNGSRVEATPHAEASCPACKGPVIAKCGDIVIWHWAHRRQECDNWYEPESAWHKEWKACFPAEYQEVVIGPHRADVKTPTLVVELQSSHISADEIIEREEFYGRMVWIIDARHFHLNLRDREDYVTFRWKWPHQSWWASRKRLVFDLGIGDCLLIKRLYDETPCGGWAKWITREALLHWLMTI